MTVSVRPRIVVITAAALLVVVLSACQQRLHRVAGDTHPHRPPVEVLTDDELDALTNAYADRFMTLIVGAADSIKSDNPSAEARRMAHLFKTASVASIYDIASNPDPFTQLIDMLLVVTLLSHVWIDEARSDDVFGERADVLVHPLRRAREDIWAIARRVMRPEQLDALDMLIWSWRRNNTDVEFVSFVRFDDFANDRTRAFVTDIRRGGGLLAPIDEARLEVERARRLAERAFFYAKRVGFLAAWEAEAVVLDVLVDPSVRQALDDTSSLTISIDRASKTFGELPDRIAEERRILLDALDERHAAIDGTLGEVRGLAQESERLAQSVTATVQASERMLAQLETTSDALGNTVRATDQLVARFDRAPSDENSRGAATTFDPEAYTEALTTLADAARELTTLVAATSALVESEAWSMRLQEATTHGDTLADLLYRRALMLLGAFFVLLLAYRFLVLWMRRRFHTPVHSPAHSAAHFPSDVGGPTHAASATSPGTPARAREPGSTP